MSYSEKFKDRMVRRMAGPSGVSATSLAKEVGVPRYPFTPGIEEPMEA